MKQALPLTLVIPCILLFPTQAMTQPADLVSVRLALHVTTHNLKGVSCDDPIRNPTLTGTHCIDYTYRWPALTPGDVWYVVANGTGSGYTSVTSGIEYSPNIEVFGSSLCADSELPSGGWPASGGGNVITWESCTGTWIPPSGCAGPIHAVAYTFYVYAYGEGTFRATENRNLPGGSDFVVANCSGQSLSLWDYLHESIRDLVFGIIHFGGDGSQGYVPCACADTEKTTWGGLKTLYTGRK